MWRITESPIRTFGVLFGTFSWSSISRGVRFILSLLSSSVGSSFLAFWLTGDSCFGGISLLLFVGTHGGFASLFVSWFFERSFSWWRVYSVENYVNSPRKKENILPMFVLSCFSLFYNCTQDVCTFWELWMAEWHFYLLSKIDILKSNMSAYGYVW